MPDAAEHICCSSTTRRALREAVAEQLARSRLRGRRRPTPAKRRSSCSQSLPSTSSSPTCGCRASTARRSSRPRVDRYPDIIAIVITGYGTVKDAVEAIKRGAADFVTKPFQFDELLHALQTALEQRRLQLGERVPARAARGALSVRGHRRHAAARCSSCFSCSRRSRATASTILITGETGTGKEVVARAIHHNSPRRAHRFVALNCSAIPETLLEAELFGHVRGAFTGAVGTRQGRFEQAHKGTLFLDEVGTMSPALQMKLLRVLQEREFERVGDSQTIKVDVRVIAATNADLDEDGRRGHVPRGSLLPAERHPGAAAAAARAARRHSAARAALPEQVRAEIAGRTIVAGRHALR